MIQNDGDKSRKAKMAWFILTVSAIALFALDDFNAGAWIAVATLTLGIYGTANIAEKKEQRKSAYPGQKPVS